jgi:hypothetical protein
MRKTADFRSLRWRSLRLNRLVPANDFLPRISPLRQWMTMTAQFVL